MEDDLGNPSGVCGYDRLLHCHGLEENSAEMLAERRQDEEIKERQMLWNSLPPAGELDPPSQPEMTTLPLQLSPKLSVSHQHPVDIGMGLTHHPSGLEEVVVPLIGNEPPDASHDGCTLRQVQGRAEGRVRSAGAEVGEIHPVVNARTLPGGAQANRRPTAFELTITV